MFLAGSLLLCLSLHFSSGEWHLNRKPRSVQVPPQPIDCELSSWSSWSCCDPCQKKRYRYTQLTRPSQFNGDACETIDRQEEPCSINSPCRNTKRCEGFQCVESGKCITRRLLCNGDDDCGDRSDEKNCKTVRSPCTDDMEQYWAIETLASGFWVDHSSCLSGSHYRAIYDKRVGKDIQIIDTQQTGKFTKSKPKGEYEFKLSEYESYSDYERNFFSAHGKQRSFSIGIKIPSVIDIGYSYNSMKFKKTVERVKKYSHTSSTFIRAQSSLEVAQYKLRSRNLMLHSEFFNRVKQLPTEYVYGEYRELFRDYGTHFITEATLGGTYEYTLVLKSSTIKNEGYSLNDVQSCLQNGFTLGGNICGVWVSLSMSASACNALLKEIGDSLSEHKMVEDFLVLVRGGSSEHIATLAHKNFPTPELMQEWGDAVYYNPDIIKAKVSPLYELVTTADFGAANILQENMKRALEEYQRETSSCRCAPCQNNGIPVFKESRCECVCPSGFQGAACEITQRPVPSIDGNWGCWSSWTPCSRREKTRQRVCNNPTPQNGGRACEDASNEAENC